MKKLHFDYFMKIEYEKEVARCFFTIKCIPQNNARQTISDTEITLFPRVPYSFGRDGLKNTQIYGIDDTPHDVFWFQITGTAIAGLADYEEEEDDSLSMVFRHPHGKNCPGPCILAYHEKVTKELSQMENRKDGQAHEHTNERKSADQILAYVEQVMHRLYRDFGYQPNSTQIATTAEEALSQGYGVCQDYAHIFIALMHLAKIPARYVTGLIVGEGASHAWVEVLADGKWYGFDPTNDKRVGDEHIKIGVGRDAQDCMINRGIMHGGGLHIQTVKVTVEEVCD